MNKDKNDRVYRVHEPDIIPVEDPHLLQRIELWLLELASGDLTDVTIQNYRYQILPFVEWWRLRRERYDHQLTPDVLKRFNVWLRDSYRKRNGKPLSPNSRRTYCLRLAEFFKWLYTSKRLTIDISSWVAVPSRTSSSRKPHTVDELDRLLLAAMDGRNRSRDVALLAFAVGTGARRHEIWAARIENIQFYADGSGACYLDETKNDKPRTVIFGENTGRLLLPYIDRQQRNYGRLFDSWETAEAIRSLMERLGERANVASASVHRLRKTFSSYWYIHHPDNERADFMLKLLLGHEAENVTEEYYLMLNSDHARPYYVSPMEDAIIAPTVERIAQVWRDL